MSILEEVEFDEEDCFLSPVTTVQPGSFPDGDMEHAHQHRASVGAEKHAQQDCAPTGDEEAEEHAQQDCELTGAEEYAMHEHTPADRAPTGVKEQEQQLSKYLRQVIDKQFHLFETH